MSPDSLFRWQVQVSVYCAMRIPAHLRCTQCSILLYLIDICFLACICLWLMSQIQTSLCVVVGPGFVSRSPVFMRSQPSSGSAWPACPPKTINRARIAGGQEVSANGQKIGWSEQVLKGYNARQTCWLFLDFLSIMLEQEIKRDVKPQQINSTPSLQ